MTGAGISATLETGAEGRCAHTRQVSPRIRPTANYSRIRSSLRKSITVRAIEYKGCQSALHSVTSMRGMRDSCGWTTIHEGRCPLGRVGTRQIVSSLCLLVFATYTLHSSFWLFLRVALRVALLG
ncbi:hypothetical protein EXIGLDRAFT_458941 [Exidia glandulosa HHB12029]|uniref:Uncharacterized protein n=1 Tax=Exidia glandulosa HHB12029 TaxID=1314781 RepID=A0A165PPY1_EXIGL|nr:hypothetical protein EXIGLDRAFT_458941 [Exidia glandulosa HHB12029]